MKGALTLTKLRCLAKLYRADVEGANEQLETLMREQWDELHPLLGLPLEQVLRFIDAWTSRYQRHRARVA